MLAVRLWTRDEQEQASRLHSRVWMVVVAEAEDEKQ